MKYLSEVVMLYIKNRFFHIDPACVKEKHFKSKAS